MNWFEKFFSGFAFWKGSFWGKIIYYFILFTAFNALYNKVLPPPKTNTITSANTVIEAENKKLLFLGVKVARVRVGISVE